MKKSKFIDSRLLLYFVRRKKALPLKRAVVKQAFPFRPISVGARNMAA